MRRISPVLSALLLAGVICGPVAMADSASAAEPASPPCLPLTGSDADILILTIHSYTACGHSVAT